MIWQEKQGSGLGKFMRAERLTDAIKALLNVVNEESTMVHIAIEAMYWAGFMLCSNALRTIFPAQMGCLHLTELSTDSMLQLDRKLNGCRKDRSRPKR